jgi:UDP-galactopyranose mutase
VEAQITNYVPDDDPTNNEQCLTFTTQFIAFEPYPSPVNDHVNIDFILPFEDNVVIELYGMKGDKVKDIYSGVAQKGLNQFTVDVSDLALAVYSYRIIYRNDQKILKFVKY